MTVYPTPVVARRHYPGERFSLTPKMRLAVLCVAIFAVIILNMTAIIVTLATLGWKVHARMLGALSAPSVLSIPSTLVDR